MKTINGLEEWGLTMDKLPFLDNVATIHIPVVYPTYDLVVVYPPSGRAKRISALMRARFEVLKGLIPKTPFEKLGTHIRPHSIKFQLPLNQLPALLAHDVVATVSVRAIAGIMRTEPVAESSFWSIKARFAIQIEDETGGLQTFEDRILLVKAASEEEARQKLLPSFEAYAKPYLNPVGLLVRWQFEEFLDAYSTGVSSLEAFESDAGVEVFSELKRRKLKPGREWKPGTQSE